MKKLLLIFLFFGSICRGQTTGAVLKNSDGSVNLFQAGVGGTVSQSGNKGSAVTINKICGQITTTSAALAAGAEVKFTVNNNLVAATDVPLIVIQSGGTSGSYLACVSAVGAGSFDITISNASAGSLSQAIVINFVIIKSVKN